MRKMRRGISLLLSIVLVLGVVPLGGRAAECQHTLTYTAKDDCITAACGNEGCDFSATAKLEPDPEVPTAYTGEEIKPLKIVYSENWLGEKKETIAYVNNIAVAEPEQKNEETPLPVGEEPQEEDPADTENQPDGEKEQDTEKPKEEKKIPSGTLTIGGVSVTRTFAIEKAELTVTATAVAAYGDTAPQYTLVCKDVKGNIVDGVITATPEMMTSDYTPETKAGTTFEIKVNLGEATHDSYVLTAENGSFTVSPRKVTLSVNNPEYDGQPHTAEITVGNLVGDDKLDAVHAEMTQTDAGDYKITVDALKVADGNGADLANYELPDNAEVSFVVNRRAVEIDWGLQTISHSEEGYTPDPTITNLVEGDDVTLKPDKEVPLKTIGDHEIRYELDGKDKDNYTLPEGTKATYAIRKIAHPKPENLKAEAETVLGKGDGKITGVTAGMEYKAKDAAEYTEVTEKQITDKEIIGLAAGDYLVRMKETEDLAASEDVELTVAAGEPLNITLPAEQTGYTLTAEKTNVGWNENVKIEFELSDRYIKGNDFAVKVNGEPITLDTQDAYTISGIQANMTVAVEGVYPLVAIKFDNTTFLDVVTEVTFEKYLNRSKTLEIEAPTGTEIHYAEKAEKTNPETIRNWTLYTGAVTVPATDRKAIFYARVTDGSGNVYYASTNGVVFDTIKPVFTVGETTIQIPSNGAAVTLECYTTQQVTVADTNLAEVRVNGAAKTQPITLKGDEEKLYIIRAEDEAGNQYQIKIQMHKIDSLTTSLAGLDKVDDILKDQRTYATEEEIEELEAIQKDKALRVNLMIQELPAADKIKPYDESHRDDYKAAQDAYDKLSTKEKESITSTNKKKLEDVEEALEYKITTDADDLKWEKSSKKDLVIKVNGPNKRFSKLVFGGNTVPTTSYSHKEDASGGTIITLEAEYLQNANRKVGKHTVKVVYTDGETDGKDKIEIQKAGTNPKTGDTGILFWMAASLVSLACLAVILPGKKKSYQA